mmetsp:Transcript_10999/g.16067  ORF Transcript_10999/g.16067 Transcript_10999/m.16067 type:complete len:299 (+) Transcript_10999:80-976(+)
MDLLEFYDSSEGSEASGESKDNVASSGSDDDDDDDSLKLVNVINSSAAARSASSNDKLFVRSVPHVRGNWAGHVFIDLKVYQSNADLQEAVTVSIRELANRLMVATRQRKQSAGDGPSSSSSSSVSTTTGGTSTLQLLQPQTIVRHEDLHVSLSRPFFLQLASLESFVRDLQSELTHRPFALTVRFKKHKILVNDERTRTFWCWHVDTTPPLLHLIESIDHIMSEYRQPTYYDPPSFHVSVASVAGNMAMEGYGMKDSATENDSDDDDDDDCVTTILVRAISCTFGTTKEFSIPLRND